MNRRTYLGTMLAGAAIMGTHSAGEDTPLSIELNVDLAVDPAKETEMLHLFHGEFHAAAARQPGFIDAKMLKLRSALQGAPPAHANYRFVLRFRSEKQRQAWVATPVHQKLWPRMEETLVAKDYTVLLFDFA